MDTLFEQALQLPIADRLRLLEKLATSLQNDMPAEDLEPRKSLLGIWSDMNIDISEEDIRELRQDMWKNFPREGI
ncbi:MAG: hypothetical protein ACPG7F_07670 [Aggregatilineales bacterium]